MTQSDTIAPHGGTLVNLLAEGAETERLVQEAEHHPKVKVNDRELSDLEMLTVGALSPLTGFQGEKDYHSILETMHLENGLPWSIPVTLSLDEGEVKRIGGAEAVTLMTGQSERPLAVLEVAAKYRERFLFGIYQVGARQIENSGRSPARQGPDQLRLDVFVREARIDRIACQRAQDFVGPAERSAAKRVLALQAGPQQDRIIGVDRHHDAGASQPIDRVILDRGVDAQLEIRGRTDAERNTPVDQQADQGRVLDRAHAVVDAISAQQFDRVSHALGAARLAGMRGAAQSRRAGALEGLRESRAGPARGRLVAVDRQRHDARVAQSDQQIDQLGCSVR